MSRFILFLILSINLPFFAQSWLPAGTVTNPGVRPSISVCGENIAWIADGGTTTPKIFRTTDGGASWITVPTGGIVNEIFCVYAFTGNTAYVGEGVVNGGANLLKTTNAGANWQVVMTTDVNRGYFNGLAFTKANGNIFGLAIAERIYRSTNSGLNWYEVNAGVNGVSNAQNSLMIVDNEFYGFGMNNGAARIRLTTNNSISWLTQQISVSGNYTSAIAFHSNKQFGIAATSTSVPMVSRTLDGGLTWNSIDVGAGVTGTCYLNWIPYTPVVYILGSNGGIKRSTDNGTTWVTTPTPGVTNLTHFDFMHSGNIVFGYAVSSNGNVIKLSDTLIILTGVNNNNQIPSGFSLEQNYPNPFNPVTTINYGIPSSMHVRLAIYDVLGREVDIIVNETRPAGKHEALWNADNFNSGVYFCKIQAEGFTDTKKLVLIK